MEVVLTKDNFDEEVLQASGTVLVDFWAPWCGPCKMLAPIIADIAAGEPDIKVGKVNVDDELELAERFQVSSIPTLLVFKDGTLVNQGLGFMPKERVLALARG